MSLTLSVITGTFNRCDSLAHMIESARQQIPRGLAYEFVIVDGGSTDDTLPWLKRQPDVRLIEHGELRGAIKAFCDGARAAQGEYVLLANDDILFKPYSILAAIAHLERTPTCGAAAFADNRTSKVHGDGSQYRVEGIGATTADGQQVMVAYPQVGLIRKRLGDALGWWGDTDPVMGQARTYGGDSYLGARIWEAGYTVDPVSLAVVEDRIQRDGLRDINASSGPRDSGLYYQRFPTVQLPAVLVDVPSQDRLRILHLPVYESGYPGKRNHEAGLTEALAEYGLAIEWDYLNEQADLIELVRAWQPDLLVTQIQGAGRITPYQLASMRNAAPGMVIVNWNGDIHPQGLTSPAVLDLLRYVDLQTTVNARVLPEYERLGIPAAYWQIGFKDPADPLPEVPAYEVLFAGNCYNVERDFLVRRLRSMRVDGLRQPHLGIYGNCRGSDGNSHYSFAMQRALYQSAVITIGDTFSGGYAYVSNRVFQALSSGAFMLQQRSEGLQEFTGLTPGIHYAEWIDLADLETKIAYWLRPEQADARQQIAQAGRDFVRANFSYPAQARKLFVDLLPRIAEVSRATA